MAAGWTLASIRSKVRNLTGTSEDALTDPQINDYINNYYVFTMPFELKNQIQIAFIDFTTVAGVDEYDFPEEGVFLTNKPEAYADGLRMDYYQDPNVFFQDWPQQTYTDSLSGNATSTYTSATQQNPIIIGSLIVADQIGLQVLEDDGAGHFVQTVRNGIRLLQNNGQNVFLTFRTNEVPVSPLGDPVGAINYTTGAYTAVFDDPIVLGVPMSAKYQTYQANRPQAILFFENKFKLRPIPDQIYQIRLEGFINPQPLAETDANPTGRATLEEWGQCIAYGASFDILMDRGDQVAASNISQVLKRFETVALGRTLQQYLNMRSRPSF
jgi:hypothetical protein